MMLYISLQPVLALIGGILILVFPRLLSRVVAIYLLIVGITGGKGGVKQRRWRSKTETPGL
jgi:hypothetical protein